MKDRLEKGEAVEFEKLIIVFVKGYNALTVGLEGHHLGMRN